MANSMVWVPEGGMLQITNRILQAEAPGASASEIIYKITQDHPQFGNFFFSFVMISSLLLAVLDSILCDATQPGCVANELVFQTHPL